MLMSFRLLYQEAGIDVRVGDIGGMIQEVMESYEVTIGTKTMPGTLPFPLPLHSPLHPHSNIPLPPIPFPNLQ